MEHPNHFMILIRVHAAKRAQWDVTDLELLDATLMIRNSILPRKVHREVYFSIASLLPDAGRGRRGTVPGMLFNICVALAIWSHHCLHVVGASTKTVFNSSHAWMNRTSLPTASFLSSLVRATYHRSPPDARRPPLLIALSLRALGANAL
jgi:hypothetical protein